MKTIVYHLRLTALDLKNARRIAQHISRLNREIGITGPVQLADVVGWALHRCVLLLADERA